MAVATEYGGRGEELTSENQVAAVRKFLKKTNAPEGELSDVFARDQLLMLYALPEPIKKRLRALKKLQLSIINMEADFYNEIHNLEIKFYQQYKPIFDKRFKIIAGKYEPAEDELHPDENIPEMPAEVKAKLKLEQSKIPEGPGIPDFWLTIFRNVGMLNEITFPHDEAILKHLVDIKVHLKNNPMGFNLDFVFTPNEFFSNNVLSKEYLMKCSPEVNDPFAFEGPEIRKSLGCHIEWKPGKDVTVKTIKKKQKNKIRGSVRNVLKTVRNESFFNFFSPPIVPDDPEVELEEDIQLALTSDFEIGHYLRERVIPHAILFYTGEALEDEESYEEDDEEDEEEEDEEDEEDEEEEESSKTGSSGSTANSESATKSDSDEESEN